MNNDNIHKLENLLNSCIEQDGMPFELSHPSYTKLYFEIFFDDIENDKGPSHSDGFIETLEISNGAKKEKVINDFRQTWDSWVKLYKELEKRAMLK